jgi:hypothetical protein
MAAEDAIYGAWADDRLAAFKAHGGKLLIYHGISDPIFSVTESIDIHQSRWRRTTAAWVPASDFARIFPVPGMTPLRRRAGDESVRHVRCDHGLGRERQRTRAAIIGSGTNRRARVPSVRIPPRHSTAGAAM